MNWTFLACGSVMLLLVGCSQAPTQTNSEPSWISQPPQSNDVIYGVGSATRMDNVAQSFELAIQQANVDISRQLKVTVQSLSTESVQVQQQNNLDEQVQRLSSNNIRAQTQALALDNSQTDARYVGDAYVYVLQKLDRRQVLSNLRQQIDEIDLQLAQRFARISSQQPLTQQWQSILPAWRELSQRQELVDAVRLYNFNRRPPIPDDIRQYELTVKTLLQQLLFSLVSRDSDSLSDEGLDWLASALTEVGLTPSLTASAPHQLRLQTQWQLQTQLQQQRHYVFVTLEASLQDAQGQTLASWTLSQRGISAVMSQANDQAYQKVSQALAQALITWLTTPNTF